ncbi:MAG: glycosyltransferase [Lachnospiraceae bacterium]|jgi:GT2 family glycosyltransferase|nr:glycosyltransferase [Lachnospiraceae bacterium]
MGEINFSIVIPTWNRSSLVGRLLESLFQDRERYQYGKTEVLVIDNSQGEEKASIAASCRQFGAQYIEGVESVRKKRNLGIDRAQYGHILFLDSDVTVEPGLLDCHAAAYLGQEGDGKLGGAFGLTEFVGKKSFWWKILELTSFVDSFGFAKQFPYVSWTIGNNVSFRKKALLEIGKFEEDLPFKLGGDDLDMSYRVTKAGYRIKTVPGAVTYHSRDTWNCWKAVNDRSKRWGSMEYHILKRHPELAHRRLPMTGDIVAFFLLAFGGASIAMQSLLPMAFWGIWCLMLYFMAFGHYVGSHGMVNPFYWTIAMFLQGKYRFHRLVMSLKNKDLSLAFQGQYFGIFHIRSDFQEHAKKAWVYCDSMVLLIIVMLLYKWLAG